MMKKLSLLLFICLVLVVSFSSCSSDSFILPADSLLSPPLYYEEYEELVEVFNKNDKTLCNPINGSYRSAIIVEDVDSDGIKEAIIFYKLNSDLSVARMEYFDYIDGRWISLGDFNGYGSEVEKVTICDMDSDGKSEILIMWNTSGASSGNILTVYCAESLTKSYKEIANESCLLSEVIDIDGNGKKDIFLISQVNTQSSNQKVARVLRLSAGTILRFGETKLDSNISSYTSVKTEKSSKESPMRVYIDALKGEQQMITEVLYWDSESSELCAPLFDTETMTNSLTFRYEPIGCADINNDGTIEIPVQTAVFGKSDEIITVDSENVYLTEWKSLELDGFTTVAYSLVNYQDGYMINLDESELNSFGIKNYRSQNCWVVYSSDNNGESVYELYSVLKIASTKWDSEKFSAYIPVIETEDSIVCVFITSDGKNIGINETFIKNKIVKIS